VTVQVVFLDYLTGRELRLQKAFPLASTEPKPGP